MNTDGLFTLQVVARHGSMAGAARELGLTANAVAQRLRALEHEMGTALVTRSGRTVQLTEAGHAVEAKLPSLLSEIHGLRTAALETTIAGVLKIGAIATALTGIMPPLLEGLSRRHPKINIHLSPGTSAELYELVLKGELDAAVIVEPDFDMPKSAFFSLLRREPFVLLTSQGLSRSNVLDIIRTESIILYDRAQWGGRLAANWLEATGVQYRARFELDALDAIAVMVARGLGVSVVPDWLGPRPEGARLKALRLPKSNVARSIGILSNRNGPRRRLVSAFSSLADEMFVARPGA